MKKKKEPLMYDPKFSTEFGSLKDFLEQSKSGGYTHIIFGFHTKENDGMVWACMREDIVEVFETLSDMYLYSVLYPIDRAIKEIIHKDLSKEGEISTPYYLRQLMKEAL